MKNRINIGTASIILIFIILCLAVFSLLSLSDGNSALVLARRRADSVTCLLYTSISIFMPNAINLLLLPPRYCSGRSLLLKHMEI